MDSRMSHALNQHTVPVRKSSLSRSPTKNPPSRTAVPERTSSLSRSPTKRPASPSEPIEKLLEEREQSNRDLKEARKRVKLSSSFDVLCWSKRCDVVRHELRSSKLTKKISMARLEDKTLDYLMTEQGHRLLFFTRKDFEDGSTIVRETKRTDEQSISCSNYSKSLFRTIRRIEEWSRH